MAIWPGRSIFLLVLSFNLLGDGRRDALDPPQAYLFTRWEAGFSGYPLQYLYTFTFFCIAGMVVSSIPYPKCSSFIGEVSRDVGVQLIIAKCLTGVVSLFEVINLNK
jgi:hypothetical protein